MINSSVRKLRVNATGPSDYESVTTEVNIEYIHKWRPINHSFVIMLNCLTSLVSMYKIQTKICLKMRLVRIIST